MKRFMILLTLLVFLLLTSICSAGEIKVYDADDQYLGILLSTSVYETTIFIPALGVSAHVTNHQYFQTSNVADIKKHGNVSSMGETDKVVFSNSKCTGTPHFDAAYPALIKFRCDDKYYKTNGTFKSLNPAYKRKSNCDCDSDTPLPTVGYFQELEETTLPFSTPLALPLKFRNSKGAVVIPLGN